MSGAHCPGVLLRAALTAATAAAAGALLLWLCLVPARTLQQQIAAGLSWTALPLDLVLSTLAAAVTAVVGLWLTAAAVATAVEVVAGCSSRLVRAASPTLVRRTVLLCCGLAVGSTVAAPATALDAQRPEPPGQAALVGLRLPDRPSGSGVAVASETEPPQAPPATTTAAPRAMHTVTRGECLWSIAAALLPRDAGPGEITAAWRELYRHNRRAVGDDPHLVRAGTVLALPASLVDERPATAHHPREEAP